MKLQLVSFKICPYVQRSVITLNHKKAKFDITYIDLENPPAWFEKASPLGKVPILIVDEKTVLFESAVINEFVDETHGTPLLPKDPLKKAFERAWIEFGSELMGTMYKAVIAESQGEVDENLGELFEYLQKVQDVKSSSGPYFRGEEFSLVDSSYAPLLMRMHLVPGIAKHAGWKKIPGIQAWSDKLLALPEVKNSVVPDFNDLFSASLKKYESLLA